MSSQTPRCTCKTCPGAGCQCGCQCAPSVVPSGAVPAQCACRPACGCDAAEQGCVCG